jgi:hypothetical protein
MDWWILLIVAGIGGYFVWRQKKYAEGQKIVSARLERDKRLYQHIKSAKREYDWRKKENEKEFLGKKDGELIFETAHMAAYRVSHFAESRVGFYFKDINEYGLYGSFVGEPGEYYDSYHRSDSTFKTETDLAFGARDD